MISNWENPSGLQGLYENISVLRFDWWISESGYHTYQKALLFYTKYNEQQWVVFLVQDQGHLQKKMFSILLAAVERADKKRWK